MAASEFSLLNPIEQGELALQYTNARRYLHYSPAEWDQLPRLVREIFRYGLALQGVPVELTQEQRKAIMQSGQDQDDLGLLD